MTITPGLAAELILLSQAVDLPGTDLTETLTRLTADSQAAVDSYLGLSVVITSKRSAFDFTVLNEGTQAEHIRTSLLVPLSPAVLGETSATTAVALILYAATPGAFIDLAADLSWITGRTIADFRLDEHRTLPASCIDPTPLAAMSDIDQAIGVLIGSGSIPEHAERDLYARAVTAGTDLPGAASLILASLTELSPGSEHL
jgi:hypothetical protein